MVRPAPDLRTPQEAAAILKIHYRAVLDSIQLGELKAYKIGRQYRISIIDLNLFIESSVFKPAVSKNPNSSGF